MSDDGPWHEGEIVLQNHVGVRQKMDGHGRKVIRNYMPDQHRELFEKLPMIFIGGEDRLGKLWASIIFGSKGFIQATNACTLTINGSLNPLDPLNGQIGEGSFVGLLGIEFETRRRNRFNGVLDSIAPGMMSIKLVQGFGNCNKYITARKPEVSNTFGDFLRTDFLNFSSDLIHFLEQIDTIFIVSSAPSNNGVVSGGVDVSHRGGNPGFLKVLSDKILLIPDFAGNNFFSTLGNIYVNPKIGILIPDFERGHLIYLTGMAELVLLEADGVLLEGGSRIIRFNLLKGIYVKNAMPLLYKKTL